MSDDTLTPEERAVLLVLTALGAETSNPQLKERFGAEIRKPVRTRLERLKLISTTTGARRTIFHEVTDQGWVRAADELTGELPTSRLAKAVAMLLASQVHGYLGRAGLRLHEVFVPDAGPVDPAVPAAGGDARSPAADPVPSPAPKAAPGPAAERIDDLAARVRETYRTLAPRDNAWVKLADLRAALSDVDRDVLDIELRRLFREPGVTLIPEENQKTLTEADRTAAIRIGNQSKHLIAMEA